MEIGDKHYITEEIIRLVKQGVKDAGSQAAFCRMSGMSEYNLSKLVNGKKVFVFGDEWGRLCDVFPEIDPKRGTLSNVTRPDTAVIRDYPIITEAAAASCNTAYYPMTDFAEEYSEGRVSFPEGREGDFVIRVTGDSMLPWYPDGTMVLVRPYVKPQNETPVIAILGDGTLVFKIFWETEDKFFLMSVNREDGRDFAFDKNDFMAVRSVFVVVQSVRSEAKILHSMREKGIHSDIEDRIKKWGEKK